MDVPGNVLLLLGVRNVTGYMVAWTRRQVTICRMVINDINFRPNDFIMLSSDWTLNFDYFKGKNLN